MTQLAMPKPTTKTSKAERPTRKKPTRKKPTRKKATPPPPPEPKPEGFEAQQATFTPQKLIEVEKMGKYFEASGLTPMAGRVFALLMLAEPPYLEFFNIQEALQASKSAISTAIKILHQQQRLIDYRTFPGDRKRYFYVDFGNWMRITRERIASTAQFKQVLERVLELRDPERDVDFDDGVRRMVHFYEFLDERLRAAMSEWEQTHAA